VIECSPSKGVKSINYRRNVLEVYSLSAPQTRWRRPI